MPVCSKFHLVVVALTQQDRQRRIDRDKSQVQLAVWDVACHGVMCVLLCRLHDHCVGCKFTIWARP